MAVVLRQPVSMSPVANTWPPIPRSRTITRNLPNMKWADYCICAVRYDAARRRIVQVETREDKGDAIGGGYREPRDAIVKNLKTGRSYITLLKGPNGKWTQGRRVHLIRLSGAEFLT